MVQLHPSPMTKKFSLIVALIVALVVGPSVSIPGASADPSEDKRRQASNIADQLERLSDQMDMLGEDYAEVVALQSDLGLEIEQAQADVAAAEAQLAQMRGTL